MGTGTSARCNKIGTLSARPCGILFKQLSVTKACASLHQHGQSTVQLLKLTTHVENIFSVRLPIRGTYLPSRC